MQHRLDRMWLSRRLLLGLTMPPAVLLVMLAIMATPVRSAQGDLDPSFGTAGLTMTGIGVFDEARAVAVQPDGKIVVAGYADVGGFAFAVARYTAAGVLDPTFGDGGRVITAIGDRAEAFALALQSDGKIVVAGRTATGAAQDVALARYLPSGALDSGFGNGGVVQVAIGPGLDWATAVAILPSGAILIAGRAGAFAGISSGDFALARLTTAGALDPTFSGDGYLLTDISGGIDEITSMAITPAGDIIVAGFATNGGGVDFAVARYRPTGELDQSFGAGGIAIADLGTSFDQVESVALQPDGMIIAAGFVYPGVDDQDFAVARFTATGVLDSGFGGGGTAVTRFGGGADSARAVMVQPDGKILLAGYAQIGARLDFALARHLPGGALDVAFGVDGRVTTDAFGSHDAAFAAVLQPDGTAVVAGRITAADGNANFGLARYTVAPPAPPVIAALSPPGVAAGGPAFTLTVTGSNFAEGATIHWNGAGRTTTLVSSAELRAAIAAVDIASVGAARITVVNLASGATSAGVSFTIGAPATPTPTACGRSCVTPTPTACGRACLTVTPTATVCGRACVTATATVCGRACLTVTPTATVCGRGCVTATPTVCGRGCATATATAIAAARPAVAVVAANNPRPSLTGVRVRTGDRLQVVATGTWCLSGPGPRGNPGECGGPSGIRAPLATELPLVEPAAPVGALLGRVAGVSFVIGGGASVVAPADGWLSLLFNDGGCCYADNGGALTVSITGGVAPALTDIIAQRDRDAFRHWAGARPLARLNADLAALPRAQRELLPSLLLVTNETGHRIDPLFQVMRAVLNHPNLGFYAEIWSYTTITIAGEGFAGTCGAVTLGPVAFDALPGYTAIRNVLMRESLKSLLCMHGAPAGALVDGTVEWLPVAAFRGDFPAARVQAGWAGAVYGAKNWQRDVAATPDYPLQSPSVTADRLLDLHRWLASVDPSFIPWNIESRLRGCYDRYFASINRNVVEDLWWTQAALATRRMLNDAGCRLR